MRIHVLVKFSTRRSPCFFLLAWLGIIFRAFLKYRNIGAVFDPRKRISYDYEADEGRGGGVAGVIADVFAQQKRGQILALKTAEALTLPIGAFNPQEVSDTK